MRGSPATAHNAPWGFARFAGESGSVANWRAVIAAALATFSVVTTEMLPVGLLTPIADSLAASTGGAAWLISLPALVAAVCAPLLVLLAGGVDRRHLLCGLLALLTVANLASAAAPTLVVLLDGPMRGAVLLVLWGLAYGGVSVALMTWVIKAAPQAMEAASALYVSVFNIGIGAGAWLGGSVADQHGAGAPLWAGIALAAGCLFAALGLGGRRHIDSGRRRNEGPRTARALVTAGGGGQPCSCSSAALSVALGRIAADTLSRSGR